MRDIYNYVVDKYSRPRNYWDLHPPEKEYLKILEGNMINKSIKRVNNIKSRITKDILNNNFNKKYQIRGIKEYQIIKGYCKFIEVKEYELYWCHDSDLKTDKLKKIIEGEFTCCRDCDKSMTFVNEKVPIMYCYFWKIKK